MLNQEQQQNLQPAKKPNLLKSTFTVSFMTITSRVTGLLRDLVFAHVFGAGAALDAFLVAFKVPNFLRRLFAEGAFSQAFVPILSEYNQTRSPDEVKEFINRMAGTLTVVLFWVTVVAVLVTPWLVWLFAPGFIHDPTRYELAKVMLRITFPYLFFISLTAFVGGILNTYGKFSIPAFTPNILNFALIAAAIFLAPHFKQPVEALAWGVFIGGAAQLLFQLPFVAKIGLLPRPQLLWSDQGVRRVAKLMLPAVVGVSVAQISMFIDTLFASFLKAGSLSWLYFSDRLTSFPTGVFGVAVATVVLPHLARKYATKSEVEFSRALDWGLKFILFIAFPAVVGIVLLAQPILATLLEYGKFSSYAVIMSSRSLIAFAIGVPAFMLVKVLASGFYSRQDIRTPVKIAITALISNIALDAILIFPLAHAGLALATSLTSILNAGLLFFLLIKREIYHPGKEWRVFFLRIIFANGLMALFLWYFSAPASVWFDWNWRARVLHLLILCVGAVIIYLGCLFVSGMRWREFLVKE
jgi:putative peptidoglycan lipid II flippase